MQLKAILLSTIVAMVMLSPIIEANSSGKHNSSAGCGCHGSSASVTISENFPSTYIAGQSYSIQVSVSGGVSGSQGGFNVEVDKGSLSTAGNSGVKVSGKSITHANKASRTWSFDWISPSSGSGTVSVNIAGMTANGANGNNGDAWTTATLTITETVVSTNTPPTVSNVQITPSGATSADDLTLTYDFNDQDIGDTESGTTIHWSKNGVHQTQHDGLMMLSKIHTTRNDDWSVAVTPSDGEDFGTTESSNIIIVLNAPPTIISSLLAPTTPTSDDDITASTFGQSDEDGDALTFEYRWYLEGTLQENLNDVDVLPSLATRSGDTWMVEIRAYDGEDYSTWVSSNPISVGQQTSNNAPTVDSITISPTNPTTTDTLVATSTSSDADMDSITITEYQWRRNGALVGITTSTVDPVSTNKGESWSVEARSFDGTDWSSWVTSSSIQILNSVPNLDSASISAGEVTTDENISVSSTMSDADGDSLTMSLKWYLDGTLQPEYNNQAMLSAQLTNKGDIWTAVVEAFDGSETSTTSQTFTVQILNSEPTISLELDDEVTSQDILTLDALVADRDEDVIETVSITWYRNGFRESSLDNATTVPSTYLGPGQEWSVEMVVTDGEVIVVSEASVIIDNAPPLAVISVLTDDLYAGERVHLSGTQSTDPDNAIVRYQWMWSGGGASGIETSFLMPLTGTIDVVLSVTDASGASNSTTMTLTSSSPLPCPNLTSIVSGNDVSLEWTWTSPEQASFEITRNGVIIGVTNSTIFADTPSLTGISSYQIQTYIDDRILESSCQSPSTDVFIESSVTDFEEGPSSVAGLGLGSIYVLLGILLLVSATLRRGD